MQHVYASVKPLKLSPRQAEALRIVAAGRFYPCLEKEEDGWHARWRPVAGSGDWVDEYVRAAAMTRLTEDAEDQRHETLHDAWMAALASRTGLVRWDDGECQAFAAELEEWAGSAAEDVAARGSIVFKLEAGDGGFSVSCGVPRGKRALKALGQASYVWGPLRGLRRSQSSRDVLTIPISRTEAVEFARIGANALREAGYAVEGLPSAAPVTAVAEWRPPEKGNDSQVAANLVVRVAGEPVTAQEIRFLLDQKSTLVFFRDRWIEVDRNILKAALRALEKGAGKKANAMAFAMGVGRIGDLELEAPADGGPLNAFLSSLRGGSEALAPVELPLFAGTLRDYQANGVAWLRLLTDRGFGALLADDMGLGKTVQAAAWMLSCGTRQAGTRSSPVLVVAPLTLLPNWERELARFAPSLRVYSHHGGLRRLASGFVAAANDADVVLTSYSLLVKDCRMMSEVAWDALVLDEAQIAKNPATQIAKAIRALSPGKRIALTGTPLENSLMDLWALEDFLNPGFLGDARSFRERFVKPISADSGSTAGRRLRRALEPFVLRRLKSDPAIAAELGGKSEVRQYCELGAAARREYESALADYRAAPRGKGDALALLTALKLACDGMTDDGPNALAAFMESGKFTMLCDLLGQIFASGESALVFTQYAKVGAALRTALEAKFAKRFPFLHGGLTQDEREREIAAFGAGGSARPTAFILSLRTGGFGLNLTKATHVIHFDRWWNPAVEAQATDRAHRIGQKKTVFVHLMITTGTVEERVDEILSRKESLKSLISDGDAFWKAVSLAR